MGRDLIVEEVRRNREALAREHGNDVDAIILAFQREDATSGVTTVSLPAKRLAKRATRRKPGKTRRPNNRMEPTRSGSRKRAAHS
jgi:hypothetical protein